MLARQAECALAALGDDEQPVRGNDCRCAPIAPVPVPLRHPDPPVALDLGAAIGEAYRRARYGLEIDYREPPPPPELPAEDAAWLDEHLRERGLRL